MTKAVAVHEGAAAKAASSLFQRFCPQLLEPHRLLRNFPLTVFIYLAHVALSATISTMHVGFVFFLLAFVLATLGSGSIIAPIRRYMPETGAVSSGFWRFWSKPSIRGLFHWNLSNGLILTLWGTVIGMAGLGAGLDNADYLFQWAYVFAVLAYLSTLGAWFTSKTVEKEHRITRRQRRQGVNPFPTKTWAGSIVFTVLFLVSLYFVSDIRFQKELRALANKLYPGNEKAPGNGCPADGFPGTTLFLFGNDGNGALVNNFPHTVVSIQSDGKIPECTAPKECPVLSVGKDEKSGILYVDMDVRDKDNKVIVQLDSEGFHVNPNNYYQMDRKGSRSSLVVKDQEGNTVVDVNYLNPRAVSIDGVMYVHGQRVPLYTQGISNACAIFAGKADFLLGVP